MAFSEFSRERGLAQPEESQLKLNSVKASTGHSQSTTGVADVIKLILAQHKFLPGHPQLNKPDKYLELDTSPFSLIKKTSHCDTSTYSRMAAVSSFRFKGVNGQVAGNDYKQTKSNFNDDSEADIPLLARKQAHLKAWCANLTEHLDKISGLIIHDTTHTRQVGRECGAHRLDKWIRISKFSQLVNFQGHS